MFRALGFAALIGVACASADAAPRVVAGERVYADLAAQVAGPDAGVVALLTNQALDPHEFEPTPSIAREVAGADITIANGLGYDAWLDRLVGAAPGRAVHLVVGELLHRRAGDNPHVWFDLGALPIVVDATVRALAEADPAHAEGYGSRGGAVRRSLAELMDRIAALRRLTVGLPVGATEPVFGPMEAALGMDDRFGRFELAQMNGTEPRASDVAAMQDALRSRRLRILFVNAQASGPQTVQLAALARAAGVPVVAVTETLPAGLSAQAWLGGMLDTVARAITPAR